MARRGRNRDIPPQRSALSISLRDHALEQVDIIVRQTIHTMVPQEFNGYDALKMLFKPDVLAKLHAAFSLVAEGDRGTCSVVLPLEPCTDLVFSYPGKYDLLSPCRSAMHNPLSDYHVRAAPLARFVDGAREIVDTYSIVKHVITWLDANATLGAMRYYLPGIATLLPDNCEVFSSELGQRFREVPAVSSYIPAIRDAGVLLAKATMLPQLDMPRGTRFTLSFGTRQIQRYDRTWTTFPYSILLEDSSHAS